MRVNTKVSRPAAWSKNCKWYESHATRCSCIAFWEFSEFCHHNPLCCFSTSVYCCKHIFCYQLSPETFGYTLVFSMTGSNEYLDHTSGFFHLIFKSTQINAWHLAITQKADVTAFTYWVHLRRGSLPYSSSLSQPMFNTLFGNVNTHFNPK
jgi:hypothetical protein